jgi:hypothetical protein
MTETKKLQGKAGVKRNPHLRRRAMSNVNLNETAPTQFQGIGGVSLAYRHFGKEGAPPVVCFQHLTGTMNNFDPISACLMSICLN